ncbi:helix-turn-helix domain-containing protein [Labedella populi]|uniref:Helix-turn-helix domain-containing protein n=1 Tax=Labedella populi TaxID=2498850 RepID=A0A3S4AV76_9MICO|nr:helix-turn-helix domain-containing protein [Labedella populi]RWZ68133.1 helix-turn-helix domain-containing protein [Labedella populi]
MAGVVFGSGIGALLRMYRRRLDLTIERLSEASGVSDRTISDIERGVSTGPQPRTVAALADALRLLPEERDSFLAAARAGRVPTTPTEGVVASPNRAVDFSGRADERALLTSMLRPSPEASGPAAPIVVTGPPGVGKTTLALECLNDVTRDDLLFVDLQGFKVAALSPLHVLQALLRQVSGPSAEFLTLDEASAAWRGLTSSAPFAVLLDNAASEPQVRPVLTAKGDVRVVVTSRRTLAGLEGARRVTLGPLRRSDSVAFLRRSITDGQEADGDLDEIARFCADLPLALRIAAARIASRPQWTVQDYANRLRLEDDRLHHLVAGDLNVESTFALSYMALESESREFFRSLALLRGSSFDAAMAAAISGFSPGRSTDLLDELVDLGLLESLGRERYRLHDLLRIFAGERLRREESDEAVMAKRDRLLQWILDTTTSAGRTYGCDERTPGPKGYRPAPAARQWLLTETAYWIDAIREAARRGRHEDVCRVVEALLDFSGRVASGVDWLMLLELATASSRHLGDTARLARSLNDLGGRFTILGDADRARSTLQEAMGVAEAIGDTHELGCALLEFSELEDEGGDAATAATLAARARDIFRQRGEIDPEIRARTRLAKALSSYDRPAARTECRTTVALLDTPDLWPVTRVHALTGLARSLLIIGEWEDALAISERFVGEAALFSDEPDFLARALRHRGFAQLGLGRPDEARVDLEAAVGIARPYAPSWWTAEIDKTLEELRGA